MHSPNVQFRSTLASLIADFLSEKRAVGYRYVTEAHALQAFDRHLDSLGHATKDLPRSVVDGWIARRLHETVVSQRHRASLIRQLALFLQRQGVEAYVPDGRVLPVGRRAFAPYIFTRDQISKLLGAAMAVALPDGRAPLRHLVMPVIFRVLYGCGLRCGEALRLTVRDVDLEHGILTIREGKFRQDRLAPVAPSLLADLRNYAAAVGRRAPDAVFFPAPSGGVYTVRSPYTMFRRLLRAAGIPHGGRGRGPRVHDLRHSFAVHRLEAWYREGADLGAKLPVLSAYMGHQSLAGTQRYLRLTAEVFPDLATRLESAYGHLIPRAETL